MGSQVTIGNRYWSLQAAQETDLFTSGQQEKAGSQSQNSCVKSRIQFVMLRSGSDLLLHMRSLCQQDKEVMKCKTKFPVLGILSLSSQARPHGVPRRGSSYTGGKEPVLLHTIFIFKHK